MGVNIEASKMQKVCFKLPFVGYKIKFGFSRILWAHEYWKLLLVSSQEDAYDNCISFWEMISGERYDE